MCIDNSTYSQLIILILKFLEEDNCYQSLHALEKESKIFFNLKYFEETIINGEWEIADKYLSAFTNMDDNRYSKKLFYELRKQKYYEALHRNDHTGAVSIFLKDLKAFPVFQNKFAGELAEILDLKGSRESEQLSCYTNTTSARAKLLDVLKILVRRNRVLQDKLMFPFVNKSALLSLIRRIFPSFENGKRSIKEELIYLILQFLDEEGFKETLHNLEQESKVFFNMNFFWEYVVNGEWDKAEKYLSAFTKIDDNVYSAKLFSEMRRHIHRPGKLPPENATRNYLRDTLQVLLEKNPILLCKLNFPGMDRSRLLRIIKLVMDWWVPYCESIKPDAKTISLKDIPTVPVRDYNNSRGAAGPEETSRGGHNPTGPLRERPSSLLVYERRRKRGPPENKGMMFVATGDLCADLGNDVARVGLQPRGDSAISRGENVKGGQPLP